jgi:NADH-quinone oxidoreductase subunit G
MSANPGNAAPVSPPDAVTIEVDGRKIPARKGQMLIQATDAAGIVIPRFCYHKKLSVAANCRMCLVEIEKAPKPMPACATPVMDGMVVRTRSEKTRAAQQGVMEFLLLNHPLDCPICDQGGECRLQDLAVGYGMDVSRYREVKRVVPDKDIGPLIATEMTRCIHCTRCVRFGEEIAGVMELGGLGRGERLEIRSFLGRSVDSELSGNVIDLCPVGALTSKPFRYTARPWELQSHPSISPHDCVGANIFVQTRRGRVMRVLPRENDSVNESWLADRDRFSYEALNSGERLTAPMIRLDGRWQVVDWPLALEYAVAGLKRVIQQHGAGHVGALAAPTSTLEEFYLLAKLVRALGSNNVDHRLRQTDFSDDASAPLFPALGSSLTELERLEAVLLVGADPRKETPLLNLRLRRAALRGASIMAINAVDYDFNYCLARKIVTGPDGMVRSLAAVARALCAHKQVPVPEMIERLAGEAAEPERAMAEVLSRGANAAVVLGGFAASHPRAAALRALARHVAELAGARLGFLPEANSAGGWLAGCLPHRGPNGRAVANAGRHAGDMLKNPLKAYLLWGVEPELDCLNGARARAALEAAEFVVMFTAFKPSLATSQAVEYADAWLPLAAFTETAGTFINVEGRTQRFHGATEPPGAARPGWKILRVLGGLLGLAGFEQENIEDVRREIPLADVVPAPEFGPPAPPSGDGTTLAPGQVWRLAEVPLYRTDALVRRASALQETADNPPPAARLHPAQADRLGLREGMPVRVAMAEGEARLTVVLDARVPEGSVLIPAGFPETAGLGGHGPTALTKEGA